MTKRKVSTEDENPALHKGAVMPSLLEGKYILDCCCGSRMFWFDKNNPAVLFADIRELETELCDGRMLEVKPDIIADFRKMPFEDNTFKMVVFDPPHLHKLGQDTWMAQKYGVLLPSWEHDIKEGFNEAMRVLEPFGTLIFKWNESQITTNNIGSYRGRTVVRSSKRKARPNKMDGFYEGYILQWGITLSPNRWDNALIIGSP